jgi:hypothetical protein
MLRIQSFSMFLSIVTKALSLANIQSTKTSLFQTSSRSFERLVTCGTEFRRPKTLRDDRSRMSYHSRYHASPRTTLVSRKDRMYGDKPLPPLPQSATSLVGTVPGPQTLSQAEVERNLPQPTHYHARHISTGSPSVDSTTGVVQPQQDPSASAIHRTVDGPSIGVGRFSDRAVLTSRQARPDAIDFVSLPKTEPLFLGASRHCVTHSDSDSLCFFEVSKARFFETLFARIRINSMVYLLPIGFLDLTKLRKYADSSTSFSCPISINRFKKLPCNQHLHNVSQLHATTSVSPHMSPPRRPPHPPHRHQPHPRRPHLLRPTQHPRTLLLPHVHPFEPRLMRPNMPTTAPVPQI